MEITVHELHERLRRGDALTLVDVREPEEWQICRIEGSVPIPLGELHLRADEIASGVPVVTICHHGVRSLRAVSLLMQRGFTEVKSLKGGIDQWSVHIDPAVERY